MCYAKLSVGILGCSIKRTGWMSEMMKRGLTSLLFLLPKISKSFARCKVYRASLVFLFLIKTVIIISTI